MQKLLSIMLLVSVGVLAGCDMNMFAREKDAHSAKPPIAKPTESAAEPDETPAAATEQPVKTPAEGPVVPTAGSEPAEKPAAPKTPGEPAQPDIENHAIADAPATAPAYKSSTDILPDFEAQSQQQILANVNGKPVFMESLHDALVQDYGLPIAQQIILDEVVRQAIDARGLSSNVTEKDIQRETQRAMRLLFGMEEEYTDEQLESLLTQFLARNRYTRRQWDQTMARNALLTRMVESSIKVTDEELQEAYLQKYDGKFKAKHIQLENQSDAQKVLEEIKKGGEFTDLVFKYSISPTAKAGGNLPEIGTKSEPKAVPPAIVSVVRAMKPGEVSDPVQSGTTFHIIKLIEITKPSDVKFEDVKAELEPMVRQYKINLGQRAMMEELMKNAKIEYVNPTIRQQERKRQENK